MNRSPITSLMAAAPVPPQLSPPTHVLPCFCVVVLQFVAAKRLKSQTLFLQVLELLRCGSHSSQNKLPCHRVQQNKANAVFLGLFLFPGGCARLLLDTFRSVFIYTRVKTCIISAAGQPASQPASENRPSAAPDLLTMTETRAQHWVSRLPPINT